MRKQFFHSINSPPQKKKLGKAERKKRETIFRFVIEIPKSRFYYCRISNNHIKYITTCKARPYNSTKMHITQFICLLPISPTTVACKRNWDMLGVYTPKTNVLKYSHNSFNSCKVLKGISKRNSSDQKRSFK